KHLLSKSVLNQALREILKIKNASIRCRELASLLPHLPKDVGQEILRHELRRLQTMEFPSEKIEVMEQIAPRLSESLLDDALKVARDIEDDLSRVEALSMFIPHLSSTHKGQVLNEILHTLLTTKAGTIWFSGIKARISILERLAPHIPVLFFQ